MWKINLLAIPSTGMYRHFLSLLVKEGFFGSSLVECIERVGACGPPLKDSKILYTLSDPFEIRYSANDGRIVLRVITEHEQFQTSILLPHFGARRMNFKSGKYI